MEIWATKTPRGWWTEYHQGIAVQVATWLKEHRLGHRSTRLLQAPQVKRQSKDLKLIWYNVYEDGRFKVFATELACIKKWRFYKGFVQNGVSANLCVWLWQDPWMPESWFDDNWKTSTTVGLAQAIHQENAFDRLPILADAMEEAGCSNPQILAMLRAEQLSDGISQFLFRLLDTRLE